MFLDAIKEAEKSIIDVKEVQLLQTSIINYTILNKNQNTAEYWKSTYFEATIIYLFCLMVLNEILSILLGITTYIFRYFEC